MRPGDPRSTSASQSSLAWLKFTRGPAVVSARTQASLAWEAPVADTAADFPSGASDRESRLLSQLQTLVVAPSRVVRKRPCVPRSAARNNRLEPSGDQANGRLSGAAPPTTERSRPALTEHGFSLPSVATMNSS